MSENTNKDFKKDLQWRLFCREYIKDFNGAGAYVRAGYSSSNANSNASHLLAREDVREYIRQLLDEKTEELDIQVSDILNDIICLKNQCMGRTPVRKTIVLKDGDTLDVDMLMFDPAGASAALEKLCKYKGLFAADNNKTLKVLNLNKDEINAELAKFGLNWSDVDTNNNKDTNG